MRSQALEERKNQRQLEKENSKIRKVASQSYESKKLNYVILESSGELSYIIKRNERESFLYFFS